jgi:iron complex transport system ATP-binding protein
MEASKAIEAVDLCFGYDGAVTLKSVGFSACPGEMIALIGPNGSGKTTLLKLLLGLLQPSSGTIALFDSPLSAYPSRERAKLIAYVSQQPASSFPLTVFELVALGRYPYAPRFGLSDGDRLAVAEALELTASQHLSARPFASLSGGEQQKVLIARALAQSARILLLDEPTLHLDLYYQLQILGALKRLCLKQRVTVLTVLHDVNLALLFADKALLLSEGAQRAFGPIAEVVNEANIKEILGVEMKAAADAETGVRYFVPRNPFDSGRDST